MSNTELKVGPRGKIILETLAEKGLLDSFVRQCEDVHRAVANLEHDSTFNAPSGGFRWHSSNEGNAPWMAAMGVYAKRLEEAGLL